MTTLHGLWDTTRMQLLVALERHGSLSQAARSIGIGQSAASEQLHLLERDAVRPSARLRSAAPCPKAWAVPWPSDRAAEPDAGHSTRDVAQLG
jgi:hypothetical protein